MNFIMVLWWENIEQEMKGREELDKHLQCLLMSGPRSIILLNSEVGLTVPTSQMRKTRPQEVGEVGRLAKMCKAIKWLQRDSKPGQFGPMASAFRLPQAASP